MKPTLLATLLLILAAVVAAQKAKKPRKCRSDFKCPEERVCLRGKCRFPTTPCPNDKHCKGSARCCRFFDFTLKELVNRCLACCADKHCKKGNKCCMVQEFGSSKVGMRKCQECCRDDDCTKEGEQCCLWHGKAKCMKPTIENPFDNMIAINTCVKPSENPLGGVVEGQNIENEIW